MVGFIWGPANVSRMACDKKKGWVIIRLFTDKEDLQIYVTKTGKVRIHSAGGKEWVKQP